MVQQQASPDKCQRFRDILNKTIKARDDFESQMGDLIDQGFDPGALMRQLKAFDDRVRSAEMSLYFCEHPAPGPHYPRRTPEPSRILDIVAAEPEGGLGYQNERPTDRNTKPGADWAYDLVGANGNTFLSDFDPAWEWIPVLDKSDEYDTKMSAVAGNVVTADISAKDVPFTHPFDKDWECTLAPDEGFEALLAPSNMLEPDMGGEYSEALGVARGSYGLNPAGILGIETDQRLIPVKFQPCPEIALRSTADGLLTAGTYRIIPRFTRRC